jgi:hypothetical protein
MQPRIKLLWVRTILMERASRRKREKKTKIKRRMMVTQYFSVKKNTD